MSWFKHVMAIFVNHFTIKLQLAWPRMCCKPSQDYTICRKHTKWFLITFMVFGVSFEPTGGTSWWNEGAAAVGDRCMFRRHHEVQRLKDNFTSYLLLKEDLLILIYIYLIYIVWLYFHLKLRYLENTLQDLVNYWMDHHKILHIRMNPICNLISF